VSDKIQGGSEINNGSGRRETPGPKKKSSGKKGKTRETFHSALKGDPFRSQNCDARKKKVAPVYETQKEKGGQWKGFERPLTVKKKIVFPTVHLENPP